MLLSTTNKKSKLKQQPLLFWLNVCFLVDYGIYQNVYSLTSMCEHLPQATTFLYPKHLIFPVQAFYCWNPLVNDHIS